MKGKRGDQIFNSKKIMKLPKSKKIKGLKNRINIVEIYA